MEDEVFGEVEKSRITTACDSMYQRLRVELHMYSARPALFRASRH
ncbi:hypothetical protein rosmuc_00460 [Roseovarius mucosus DSM 17069]|uniref:Uncharacterized protein n=1 Tax=Roseovarius mucosus DSM 17069 TaxID=1288298 RepID=A0A0A0HPX1_9RHOB|nr:hypothetical protein rosmuc_00460 [Roseovarius mucosus DSM 17069]